MAWDRANATQAALARAEQHFLSLCEREDEVDDVAVEAAYEEMEDAAAEADEALDEIRVCHSEWAAVVARLR